MKNKSEHMEQIDFFQKVRSLYAKNPTWYHLIFAIPNGGQRHPATALKMQAEGQKSGVPDIFCAIPMGKFHGLFIEMKRKGKASLSVEQKKALNALHENGYMTAVAYGSEEAWKIFQAYITQSTESLSWNDNGWYY